MKEVSMAGRENGDGNGGNKGKESNIAIWV